MADGPGRFAVVDPATAEVVGEAVDQGPRELDGAVERAHAAWRGWRADPAARTAALRAAADAVTAAADELAPLLTREQGKPLAESHAEVARTADRLRYFAGLTPESRTIEDGRPVRGEISWRPLGPVAAIVPWNFPLQLASAKFAPALAAGGDPLVEAQPRPGPLVERGPRDGDRPVDVGRR
ncbi:aldehyde dehydrogenase family protein, partial [Streptomyces sp. NPDC096080]|uniref:aldehyde dehydrogenase family protein n=1 Tax=Streptomyces sp. NPDC096080 TaxID=3156693 RepID=UPI00331B5D49